ncbi:dimethylarginine dimethylaminohydrolase family protein [Fodinicola acaciae]|uniref:dimethylarginine dimethylaminohydrolase family protein n=1 Tax=Fodinicola acaciae TaxID=2681555 RepID=UPI0013D2A792|nr:arginine deiminase-related protein [Fodinicola acaciae]
MNSRLLVCDPRHFRIDYEINPYMHTETQPELAAATAEHEAIVAAHLAAGRKVEYVAAAPDCPDMVYTANAAVVRGDHVVLANLPPERQAETPYHRAWFAERDYRIVQAPYAFSGQGDALACGDLLFAGHGQRTDRRTLDLLADFLDYRVVPLRTVSARWYDLDLALSVIDADTLAYCPEAFDQPSLAELHSAGLDLIEVSRAEADNFALNLVSDGTTVTMTTGAPVLAARLRERGKTVVQLETTELRKGGGGIRCTALTLDNA